MFVFYYNKYGRVLTDFTMGFLLPLTRVKSTGSGGVVLCLETEDVGAAIAKAVSAGAVAEGEIVEGDGACYGGSVGKVKDPYGYVWLICSPGKKCAVPEA